MQKHQIEVISTGVGGAVGITKSLYAKFTLTGTLAKITFTESMDTVYYAALGGVTALLISYYGKKILNKLHK